MLILPLATDAETPMPIASAKAMVPKVVVAFALALTKPVFEMLNDALCANNVNGPVC